MIHYDSPLCQYMMVKGAQIAAHNPHLSAPPIHNAPSVQVKLIFFFIPLFSDHFSPHVPQKAVNLSLDKRRGVGKMEKFSPIVVNFKITFGLRGPLKCKVKEERSMASLHHLVFALSDLGELWGLDLIGAALNHKL